MITDDEATAKRLFWGFAAIAALALGCLLAFEGLPDFDSYTVDVPSPQTSP